MPDTYGFGGSDPTREVPEGHQISKSSTGSSPAPVVGPLEGMFTDNIRGQSPVSGLMPGDPMCNSEWEVTTIHPSWNDHCRAPSGAATGLGSWPIENYGNDPRQSAASGEGMSDWTGHNPGDEE